MPWAEKYRPSDWSDLTGNRAIQRQVKALIERGHIKGYPILKFTGIPGIGKTSLAIIVGNTIKALHKADFELENPWTDIYNMSDKRGIEFIRKLEKKLEYRFYATYILDESDNLTHDAQEALRKVLDKKPDNVCIIIIGNDDSKFTKAIKSRCIEFFFEPLNSEEISQRLGKILEKEGVVIKTKHDVLYQVSLTANGDMRRAINEVEKILTVDNTITDESCELLFGDYFG